MPPTLLSGVCQQCAYVCGWCSVVDLAGCHPGCLVLSFQRLQIAGVTGQTLPPTDESFVTDKGVDPSLVNSLIKPLEMKESF